MFNIISNIYIYIVLQNKIAKAFDNSDIFFQKCNWKK